MFKFLKDCCVSIFLFKSLVNQSLTSCSQAMSSSLVLPLRHKWTQAFYRENMGMLVFWPEHIYGKLLASASVCPFTSVPEVKDKSSNVHCLGNYCFLWCKLWIRFFLNGLLAAVGWLFKVHVVLSPERRQYLMTKLLLNRGAYTLMGCTSKAPNAVITYRSELFSLGWVLQSIIVAFRRVTVPLLVRLSLLPALLSHVLMCENYFQS